jgi:hypothetical protein
MNATVIAVAGVEAAGLRPELAAFGLRGLAAVRPLAAAGS